MQEELVVKADLRGQVGSRAARKLRSQGQVPGIIYGHKEAPVSITVPTHDLETILAHHGRTVKLELDGQPQQLLIKQVQYDHLGEEILHVDLTRVSMDEKVTVRVQLELRGTPAGVKEGGVLDQQLGELEIESLVVNIPEAIRVSVGSLNVDDVLHVKDLELPEGVAAVTAPEAIVVQVRMVLEQQPVEEEAETEAEPEIIGRAGKPESEAEAADSASSGQ